MISILASFLFAAASPTAGPVSEVPPPEAMNPSGKISSYIMIDPKGRAGDLLQAYNSLKKERTKVSFLLNDGTQITSIIDLQLLPNGTAFIVKTNSNAGVKSQLVFVEDIATLNVM